MQGNKAYIYHCYKHYMCPVGFEEVPCHKSEVYRKDAETETTFLIADNSRKSKTFHCVKWSEIQTDLTSLTPYYINVRKPHLGMQARSNYPESKYGQTSHCIIELFALKQS